MIINRFSCRRFTAFLISGLVTASIARAGRLEEIETSVETSSSSHHHKDDHYHYGDDTDDFDWLGIFFQPRCYRQYPYYYTEPGIDLSPDIPEKRFSLTGGAHYFYDTHGDLDGFRGELLFGTPFGKLGGDFTRFREDLKPGHDYLNLYYIDYRFGFDLPGFTFDVGGGYAGMTRDHSYDGGSVFLAAQVWPLDPLGIDVMLRGATINRSSVGDYRIGVSLVYRWGGIRIGYRYLNFEKSPDIYGPEFGIQFWF